MGGTPSRLSQLKVYVTSAASSDSWATMVRSQLYFALRRSLTQRQRNALKRQIAASRRRFGRLYVGLYGQYTAKEIVASLGSRITDEFDILMVHSAYDGLLPMYRGTPQELIGELLAFCGPRRTLAMPAFVLGGRLYNKREFFKTRPFDVRRTASEVGLLTEVFRRMPGVMRSLHPTHSICAIGPLGAELTEAHHLAPTRTGHGTPFHVMAQKRTPIVGLGVEYFRCLTQTHSAEDLLGEEFPISFKKAPFVVNVVDWDGNMLNYDLTIPETSKQLDNTRLRGLLTRDELLEWRFHGSPMFATYADVVTNRLIDAARKGVTVYADRDVRSDRKQ
jgi:aminoglycoside 3-N-acetyltransferase